MRIIDLKQGSEDWHKFRKTHIGASMAPIIMGDSPWSTPNKLWCQMLDLIPADETNDRMQRGLNLEQKARECFEKKMNLKFRACVGESLEIPYLSASFDGFNFETSKAVEIKCPGEKDHELACRGIIPQKYIVQLQHQMFIGNLDYIYYFSYVSDDNNILVIVNRDNDYICKMLEKEEDFWNCLQSFTPPEMTNKDYQTINDDEWSINAAIYKNASQQEKYYKDLAEKSKKKLIQIAENQSSMGSGIKLTKFIRLGTIEYSSIPELTNVDLNIYRKSNIEVWKLTDIKETIAL